jgi:hypothetical protein
MLGSELQATGALLSVARSDDRAVHMSKSFRPQLFISKVDLPEIGDLADAIEIKRCNPECKVMLLSFWEKDVGAATILKAGDFTFHLLSRPQHPAVLFDQIEAVFDHGTRDGLA